MYAMVYIGIDSSEIKSFISDCIAESIHKEFQVYLRPREEDTYLTATEVRGLLGIGRTKLWQLQRAGLPYHKVGRKISFKKSEVVAFIEKGSHGKLE